jgi:hypothetical protein
LFTARWYTQHIRDSNQPEIVEDYEQQHKDGQDEGNGCCHQHKYPKAHEAGLQHVKERQGQHVVHPTLQETDGGSSDNGNRGWHLRQLHNRRPTCTLWKAACLVDNGPTGKPCNPHDAPYIQDVEQMVQTGAKPGAKRNVQSEELERQ